MNYKIREIGDVTIIDLEEDIITEHVEEFDEIFESLLSKSKYNIVINFRNINFLCSSGLGVIVSVFKKLKEQGGAIKLLNMNDRVRRLFEITRLNKLMEEFDDEDSAVKSYI